MFLCLIGFLHDIVLDIAVGSFISSSSMDCSEIALSKTPNPETARDAQEGKEGP